MIPSQGGYLLSGNVQDICPTRCNRVYFKALFQTFICTHSPCQNELCFSYDSQFVSLHYIPVFFANSPLRSVLLQELKFTLNSTRFEQVTACFHQAHTLEQLGWRPLQHDSFLCLRIPKCRVTSVKLP